MNPYVRRVVDDELDVLVPQLSALALEGPKGVGKTETALRRAVTVHRLDDPGERVIAGADPARLVWGDPPVLIDEWQRLPEVWDLVRRAVDDGADPGRFLLTGSATPTDPSTHSGAGRIVTVRMRPMTLAERGAGRPTVSLAGLLTGVRGPVSGETGVTAAEYAAEIVGSGLPGLRHLRGRALRAQLDGYLQRIVDRDFDEAGRRVRNPAVLRRWMAAYAAASSSTATFETLREAAASDRGDKPPRTTTIPYRDVLERLWVVDPLPAWLPSRNRIARLSAPPKHHLADPALAARLLGVDAEALLDARPVAPPVPRDQPLFASLFESLVCLDVRVYAQGAEATVGHLRTKAGEREIDLIVERGDGRVVAVEVKLARTIGDGDVRHLRWLRDQIGDDLLDAAVITTGPEAYRRPDGIAVIPAALLGP